jgi:hypothetical protein
MTEVKFRLTCPRHRGIFLKILHQEGVDDAAEMERIRLRLVALVMRVYPAAFLQHIEDKTCMGCAFEESGPTCWAWVTEALLALIHQREPPPSVYKTWTEQAWTDETPRAGEPSRPDGEVE